MDGEAARHPYQGLLLSLFRPRAAATVATSPHPPRVERLWRRVVVESNGSAFAEKIGGLPVGAAGRVPVPQRGALRSGLTALFRRFAYFVASPRPPLFSGKGVSEHVQTAPTPF